MYPKEQKENIKPRKSTSLEQLPVVVKCQNFPPLNPHIPNLFCTASGHYIPTNLNHQNPTALWISGNLQFIGWFEIQKLEYLEKGTKRFYKIKKFLTLCLIWHIFRGYYFAVKVNIKWNYWVKFLTMTNHERTLFYELTSFIILWII